MHNEHRIGKTSIHCYAMRYGQTCRAPLPPPVAVAFCMASGLFTSECPCTNVTEYPDLNRPDTMQHAAAAGPELDNNPLICGTKAIQWGLTWSQAYAFVGRPPELAEALGLRTVPGPALRRAASRLCER